MAKRRRRTLTRLEKMLRSDGALAVTFVNTGAPARKTLETYDDLLGWGVETGAIAAGDAQRLAAAAAEQPARAKRVARGAQALRDRIGRIFLAVIRDDPPADSDFDPFNTELRRAMAARQLLAVAGGHRWTWGALEDVDFDRVLWPVLLSAADVLTGPDRATLRRCPTDGCGLFFLARSPGKPRKWCGRLCRSRYSSRNYYHGKRTPMIARRKDWLRRTAANVGYGPSWSPEAPEEDEV